MDRNSAISKLKEIIRPFVKDQHMIATMTEETDFINDLKINSANLVDIVLDVEDAFEISIDNESMERMLDVKSALEIIETKLAEK